MDEVGRNHYLDMNDGAATQEELDNVDGYETALLLIESGEGTITPYGVVYGNGMQLRAAFSFLSGAGLCNDYWHNGCG